MNITEDMAAIVTGGASGLGEATARALAGAGAKVFDMNEERGQAVAAELGGVFCKVDVADEVSVQAGLDKARERILMDMSDRAPRIGSTAIR